MKKTIAGAALAILFTVFGIVAALPKASGTYLCTLTNKTVTACCCETRNGKLYCTLAKKEIPSCCCKESGK